MDDRELLELAAKAAGIYGRISWNNSRNQPLLMEGEKPKSVYQAWGNVPPVVWNPLTDDGDALRLAVTVAERHGVFALQLQGAGFATTQGIGGVPTVEGSTTDLTAATRRAIVRAAAEIGKAMV